MILLRVLACSLLPLVIGCSTPPTNSFRSFTQPIRPVSNPKTADGAGKTYATEAIPDSMVAVSSVNLQTAQAVKSLGPRPTVTIQYRYYSVAGSTVQHLRSQIAHLSPVTQGGRQYDANTDWYVRWAYRYARTATGCSMRHVTTHVDITFTLPKWQNASGASRSLMNQWHHYSAALQLHENGHKDHGIAAGQEVLNTLSRLPAYSSCQALEAAANSAARQVIQHYNQKDIEYDHDTGHGFTQGAVFPPSST